MKKTCESAKRFGKDGKATAAKRERLESFIRATGGKAYHFAYKLSGNSEDAKELVQEACFRVARSLEGYELSKPLGSFFFTVLRNAYVDSRRRYERRYALSLDFLMGDDGLSFADVVADGGEGIPERLEREERAGRVRRALESLPSELKTVLQLCYMDELRCDEAARNLGICEGTVRSRLFRARAALRRKMARY